MKGSEKKGFKKIFILAGFLLVSVFVAATYLSGKAPLDGEAVASVRAELVCMVNDTVMDKPQIPVAFEGKTYYGCCEACVEAIKTDPAVRSSVDPVSGRAVDKAASFIIEGPAGEALYFESRETAIRYMEPGA